MIQSEYRKLRIVLAQKIDEIFFEPGNASRCHKWVHRCYGQFFLGNNYDTYLDYVTSGKYNFPEVQLPEEIVTMLKDMKRLDTERRNTLKQKSTANPGKLVTDRLEEATESLPAREHR